MCAERSHFGSRLSMRVEHDPAIEPTIEPTIEQTGMAMRTRILK